MNAGEPLSTRAARMRIYNQLVNDLDSGGAHYSQELSEVDLSDPEDVKVQANNPDGEVLVHLGSSNYLERYKVYVSHVQEWRQQFNKVESVDLRYEHQIIVNPDLGGAAPQPPISAKAAKAAMAAGVKDAALIQHVVPSRPAAASSKGASAPAAVKSVSRKVVKPAHPAVKKAKAKTVAPAAKKTVSTKTAAVNTNASAKPTMTKSNKPSPAIAKQQDHP
jgi:cell division protein FtsQ